jgi:DNA-binding winged helix-turn-helix (wHTH) protein
MVKKATETHPDANKRKLIIANKASFNGAFIDDGKISLTGNDKSYIVGDNLELLLKILLFKISDIIGHYTKYRQDFLEKEVYSYIPDIRKLGINDITEDEFYKLIGLTRQEINQIKKVSSEEDVKNDTITISKPDDELPQTDVPKVKSKKTILVKKKLVIKQPTNNI